MFIFTLYQPSHCRLTPFDVTDIGLRETGAIVNGNILEEAHTFFAVVISNPAFPTIAAITAPSLPLSWPFFSLCSSYIKEPECLCKLTEEGGMVYLRRRRIKSFDFFYNIIFPLHVRSKSTDIYPPRFIYYIRITVYLLK